MMLETIVLPLHLAATGVMTGVIWFVQLIQYPWFHEVPRDRFCAYHQRYTQRIGLIVGPAMMMEVITGVVWAITGTEPYGWPLWISLAILAIIWLSTILIQIPCHQRLSQGYDARVHARLVSSNWIRTVGWSIRLAIVTSMMF